jgi:hypothetical protein
MKPRPVQGKPITVNEAKKTKMLSMELQTEVQSQVYAHRAPGKADLIYLQSSLINRKTHKTL